MQNLWCGCVSFKYQSSFLCALYANDCATTSPIDRLFKLSDDTAILGLLSEKITPINTSTFLTSHNGALTTTSSWTWTKQKKHYSLEQQTHPTTDWMHRLHPWRDSWTDQQLQIPWTQYRQFWSTHHFSKDSSLLLNWLPCSFTKFVISSKHTSITHTHTASKIICLLACNLSDMNHRAITHLALKIANDSDHPLNTHFTLLPSCPYLKKSMLWQKLCSLP